MVSSCAVEFGDTESMLGNLGPGNDDWAPLFFSIIPDGSVAIPDYYKSRIAIYSPQGRYLKAIAVDGIVSPRMNYFGTTKAGQFVAFNDATLYCLAPDGSVLWSAPFPLGVLPRSIVAGEEAVFFSAYDDSNGLKGISIPTAPPFQAADATYRDGAKPIPYFSLSGKHYGYTLADTAALNGKAWVKYNAASMSQDARFLAADASGRTAWTVKEDATLRLHILDQTGKTLFSYGLPAESSWYWAVARFEAGSLALYVYLPEAKKMVIKGYNAAVK